MPTSAQPILITLLRHGEVDGPAHVLRGVSDEPLSAHGHAQMQQALLRAAPFDAIASSPLKRCQAFARDYANQHGVPVQVLAEFRELDFGTWEGLTPAEAAVRDPLAYPAFCAAHGMQAAPAGESLSALRTRVRHGWQTWMQQDCGYNRLLITHAGVLRALLMELFGFTPAQAFQIALPPAACVRISHLHGHMPFLLSLNAEQPCAD